MLRCLVPLTARHCRHYARRRPARGGKDARDSAFSPTLGKPTKPAANLHHPMHGASAASAAAKAEPPDVRVTILGSMVFVVGLMGAGTIGYRLYSFGEISAPVEPQQAPPGVAGSAEAGAELSAPLTINVRLSLSPAAASPLSPSVHTCVATHAAQTDGQTDRQADTRAAAASCLCRRTHWTHAPHTLRAHRSCLRTAFTRGAVPCRAVPCAGAPCADPGRVARTVALARRRPVRPADLRRGHDERAAQWRHLLAVGEAAAAAGHAATAVEGRQVGAVIKPACVGS